MRKIQNYEKFLESKSQQDRLNQILEEKIKLRSDLESMLLESVSSNKKQILEHKLYVVDLEIHLIKENIFSKVKDLLGNLYDQFVGKLASIGQKFKVPVLALVILLQSLFTHSQGPIKSEQFKAGIPIEVKAEMKEAGYSDDQILKLEDAIKDPEMIKIFSEYSVDNNIRKALDELGPLKSTEVISTAEHEATSKEDVEFYLKNGFHLVDLRMEKDTSYFNVPIEAPDTALPAINLDSDDLFDSGKWDLKDVSKLNEIQKVLNHIKDNNGTVKEIVILSSTDYQRIGANTKEALLGSGYEGTNIGLSNARNDAMKNYIIKNGVSSNKIKQEAFVYGDKKAVEANKEVATIPSGEEQEYQDLRFVKVVIRAEFNSTEPTTKVDFKVSETPVYKFIKLAKQDISKGGISVKMKGQKQSFHIKCGTTTLN